MSKETRRERTKREFIVASKQIIESDGISNVSARKVGELSGYSYATIYNYFKDINTLLTYVSLDYLQEAFKYTTQDDTSIKNPLDKFIHYTKRYMTYMTDNPSIFHLIFVNDLGESIPDMEDEIQPSISQKLKETLLELNTNRFKLSFDVTYELIAASIHSKILFFNTKRGFYTRQEMFHQIEKEIREVANQWSKFINTQLS